jgi:hypothetical protein
MQSSKTAWNSLHILQPGENKDAHDEYGYVERVETVTSSLRVLQVLGFNLSHATFREIKYFLAQEFQNLHVVLTQCLAGGQMNVKLMNTV